MSFDDGSLGQQGGGEKRSQRESGLLTRTGAAARKVGGRLRRHVVEWPRRYVEQQASLYERRPKK